MSTLTPEGNKLLVNIISGHDEHVRAAVRVRCAAIARLAAQYATSSEVKHAAEAIAVAIENDAI